VQRKAYKISESDDGKKTIYVDAINAETILNFINQDERHKKKFKFIEKVILGSLRMTGVYDKEEINNRCKGITAMKFFKGQENARIYCKELSTGDQLFVVIAAELLERKKSQKLTKKEIQIIEKVASYEYILEE
jgi:ABC-type cobalamin/Fe3+-siderophores transport system ATPase subunit